MKKLTTSKSYVALFIVLLLLFSFINIAVINTGVAHAKKASNLCRLIEWYCPGGETMGYKCYVTDTPPGWNCIGCPWIEQCQF